ncbi:MAG: enoyl-CoA hydratase/isomerase family protein [Deltaproteobacteria bacterium]|nr:enoyl-CoA hydratase/isomerase family protein [Deltaproteobacteria bacterium]
MYAISKIGSFTHSEEHLRCFIEDGVGVIDLKDNAFEIIADLCQKDLLLQRLSLAEVRDEIRVVLLRSDPSALGEENYNQFWKNVSLAKNSNLRSAFPYSASLEMQVAREENTLSQLITKVLTCGKLIIATVNGSVVEQFLSMALAADYRIASESTVFSFPHVKIGMPPQGAITHLLSRCIGYAETKRILLKSSPINAEMALKMNLVDEVMPDRDFDEMSMRRAQELKELDPLQVGMIKRLLEHNEKELERCFSIESKLVVRRWLRLSADSIEAKHTSGDMEH